MGWYQRRVHGSSNQQTQVKVEQQNNIKLKKKNVYKRIYCRK